jgi:hypothetical protein
LCTIAAELRARGKLGGVAGAAAVPARASRRPDLALAFALGGSVLVHPVVGMVVFAAAGLALVLYPSALGRRLIPALGSGLVLAIPQALTMGDIAAPSWVGAVFIVASVATAFGLAYVVGAVADAMSARTTPLRDAFSVYFQADAMRAAFLVTSIVILLVWARHIVLPSDDPTNPSDPSAELMQDFPHLVWLSIAGAVASIMRIGRGWTLLGCGIVAGLAAWTATGFVGTADLTQKAVHYEVPKSVEYWLPVMLAIGAAGAIAALWRLRWLAPLRPAMIGVCLLVSVYPTTMPLATDVQIGEHRASESLGLALREAEIGYWTMNGYPDTRLIIDAPRQEVVDELRAEETAGRLGPSTKVLNIAWWFQEWTAVPIGVFTGAMETSISLYPERSIHTVGGRLLGFDSLDAELASDYGYVVLEPARLKSNLISQIRADLAADGYKQIWSNFSAVIYRR